ncbi:MAG: hypothetical protein HQK58_03020 [Deltaproteobacteria bacterium]|nr:hypothetical protein [Deltaproteobacteria bacterium]
MKIEPNLDAMIMFVLLVLPGLISMHIYRLLMPAKDMDWKNSLLEGLFYSTLNFALLLPLIVWLHWDGFVANHPVIYIFSMMFVVLVFPIFLPYLWSKLIKWRWLMRNLQSPYPTAWDFFFGQRKCAFVLIHHKNGNKIGGYYGRESFASSYPRGGDIYLETVIAVDDGGRFIEPVDATLGLLIRKNDYELIEFFQVGQLPLP